MEVSITIIIAMYLPLRAKADGMPSHFNLPNLFKGHLAYSVTWLILALLLKNENKWSHEIHALFIR